MNSFPLAPAVSQNRVWKFLMFWAEKQKHRGPLLPEDRGFDGHLKALEVLTTDAVLLRFFIPLPSPYLFLGFRCTPSPPHRSPTLWSPRCTLVPLNDLLNTPSGIADVLGSDGGMSHPSSPT